MVAYCGSSSCAWNSLRISLALKWWTDGEVTKRVFWATQELWTKVSFLFVDMKRTLFCFVCSYDYSDSAHCRSRCSRLSSAPALPFAKCRLLTHLDSWTRSL